MMRDHVELTGETLRRAISSQARAATCVQLPEDAPVTEILREFSTEIFAIASETLAVPAGETFEQDSSFVDLDKPLWPFLTYADRQLKKKLAAVRANGSRSTDLEVIRRDTLRALSARLKSKLLPILVALHDEARRQQEEAANISASSRALKAYPVSSARWLEALFTRYPVLLTLVQRMVSTAVSSAIELSDRLTTDISQMRTRFGIAISSSLMHLSGPAGDLHAGGRGVQILHFSAGEKVVYKPRPLGVFPAFDELIHWARSAGFPPMASCPHFIDRGEYGWTQFIEFSACAGAEEAAEFYHRQGATLAWLYFLGSIDLLGENIICQTTTPFLIDLECLLAPRSPIAKDNVVARSPGARLFADSVIRTGLIPVRSVGTLDELGRDLSGLSPTPEQIGEEGAFDEAAARNHHLPHIGKELQDASCYSEQLLDGFAATYRKVIKHQAALLGESGPLRCLTNLPIRLLFRPTLVYSKLAHEARFPEYLRDAVETDRLFTSLWNAHDEVEMPDEIIRSEFDQMWHDDIPYFYTSATSTDVLDDAGRLLRSGYFEKPAIECTRERIRNASEADLSVQCRIVEEALAIFGRKAIATPLSFSSAFDTDTDGLAEPTELVAAASAIADFILDAAIEDENDVSWIDTNVGRLGEWEQGPKPLGLYDGLEGIALFLAYLHRARPSERLERTVQKIARHSLREFRKVDTRLSRLIHNGWVSPMVFPVSTAYLWEHLLSLGLVGTEAFEVRESCLNWIETEFKNDVSFDPIVGSTGAIHLLVDLYERNHMKRALDLAIVCAEHLVAHGVETPDGMAWDGPVFRRLGGFAHGAASMAWTLFRVGAVSGRESFTDCARGALQFDRSFFDRPMGTWRDGRRKGSYAPSAWCHGSAGIALGRLLSGPHALTAASEREFDAATSHMIAHGFDSSSCLCHGDMGNLEILFALARHRKNEEARRLVCSRLRSLLRSVEEFGHQRDEMSAGNRSRFGLFLGLSGVGYGFLRFANWRSVPSVLALEGPMSSECSGNESLH